MKTLTPLLLCLILFSTCANRTEVPVETYDRNQFFVVDYESILKNTATVKLSELAREIEYIQLETNKENLLHPRADYHFTKDYIFVDNTKFILQFDRQGNFIKQIGKQGRGPGEIGLIRIMTVLDEEQKLVVQTNWSHKLYYFNFEGEFLENVSVADTRRIVALSGDRLLYFDGCARGYEKYMFALTDLNGDTLDVVPNHYNWENKTGFVGTMSYHLFYPFYKSRDILSFKSMHNDTVYHVLGDSIMPEYYIELGKYRLPQEYRVEVDFGADFEPFKRRSKGFRFVNTFEAGDRLFIASQDYQEDEYYCMIFDRISETGVRLTDSKGKDVSVQNDMDGGPNFWPRAAANDSTLYMPLLPYQMITEEARQVFAERTFTDVQKRQEFMDMVGGLKENDNPILMLVHLK